MADDIKVETTSREVIQDRLLDALDEGGKVAVLLTLDDLLMLIDLLETSGRDDERAATMLVGLRKLLEAFK
jgi:hypothetical protein